MTHLFHFGGNAGLVKYRGGNSWRDGTGRYFSRQYFWRDGTVVFFFLGGTGRLVFFSEAGRGGFFFFQKRDGAVVFFSEAGRGGCFFFPRRDGAVVFFFEAGRDGVVVFFQRRDGIADWKR